MKDKVFIDTNIFIYFLLDNEKDSDKRLKAREIVKLLSNKEIVISIQVLNEIYSTLLKYKVDDKTIQKKIDLIVSKTNLTYTNMDTVRKCWEIKLRYKYSYWDSLILAAALQSGCSVLYSEDMHNNQIIEDQLSIINPLAQKI